MERPTVAYYLSIVGGSFEVLAGITNAFQPRLYYPYYAIYGVEGGSIIFSLLIAVPGLVILFLSQRVFSSHKIRRISAIVVIGMSVVSLWGVLESGVFLIQGLLLPGPYLSFAGGVLGLLWRPSVVESTV